MSLFIFYQLEILKCIYLKFDYTLQIKKQSTVKLMIKTQNPYNAGLQPTCKKIQNYIFKFSEMIGQGNFSKVYKAHHQITNEVVAIKIIQLNSLKSKKLQQLLFSEIDVLKKLNHPNILKCHQVFTSNRNCYIITQLCNGGDLESQLRKIHHYKQIDAQPIIKDIFNGLLYLAEKNVIHRDLKIANIFLHNGKAKIADFGFAKFTKQKFKDINIGSPIYMSPQGLINNYYGPKTDIWSFGILIYQILHGETPYAFCQTENQLKYHISIPLTWNKIKADISNDIKELILRCMEVQDQKRISAFEIKNLPYMRKLLNQNLHSQSLNKKIEYQSPSKNIVISSNGTQNIISPSKYSAQIRRRNILSSENQKRYSPMNIHQNRNLSSKNIKKMQNNLANHSHAKKGVSAQKFTLLKLQQQENNHSSKRFINRSMLIISSITFKECVNILHYCRLLYKYIITLKESPYCDQAHIDRISSVLIKLLKQINQKIQNKEIIYEGENIWLREKKLKEVASEYTKKYTSQLGNLITSNDMNVDGMRKYFYSLYEHIDNLISKESNRYLLILGHSIVMICDATRVLRRCQQQGNYGIYGQYKDLQKFLNMNKDAMDLQSYMIFRKKLSYESK